MKQKQKKKSNPDEKVVSVTLDIDPDYLALKAGAEVARLSMAEYMRRIFAVERRTGRVQKRQIKAR